MNERMNFVDGRLRRVKLFSMLCFGIAIVGAGLGSTLFWKTERLGSELRTLQEHQAQLLSDISQFNASLQEEGALRRIRQYLNVVEPGVGRDPVAVLTALESATPGGIYLLRVEYSREQGRMLLEVHAKDRQDMARFVSDLEAQFESARISREESAPDGIVFRLAVTDRVQ